MFFSIANLVLLGLIVWLLADLVLEARKLNVLVWKAAVLQAICAPDDRVQSWLEATGSQYGTLSSPTKGTERKE